MQIRISRVTRNGKTYEYTQLVESYRRESDGMPTHRVVANLGSLSRAEFDNLKLALAAGREGKRVVLARPAAVSRPKLLDNLRYLDVAVLLEVCGQWGLQQLLTEVLRPSEAEVSSAAVVIALAIQRCVAPGSTLYATEWFPTSALPELLGIAPATFNNTRLHRVLEELDAGTADLQRKLPRLYQQRDGAFVSLFVDVTDTWFVGHGPPLCARGKTKEGRVERKVGLVLLCNEHGYPLRWEVIEGNSPDGAAMTALLRAIAGCRWVGEAPVVCDRAMGRTAQIRDMADTGLRFVTALTLTEFSAYADRIPHQALGELQLTPGDEPHRDAQAARAGACVAAAGMHRVDDTLFVLDLGVVERSDDSQSEQPAVAGSVADAMKRCQQLHEAVQDGRFSSLAAAARDLGLGRSLAIKYHALHTLAADLQRAVLAGEVQGCTLADLLAVARLQGADAQREAFIALQARSHKPRPARAPRPATRDHRGPLRVRAVAYFNPQRFVDQRLRALTHKEQLQAFVSDLNASLAAPRSRATHASVVAAVDRKLRSQDALALYEVTISAQKLAHRSIFQVTLTLDEQEWHRRRRYDGFTVLVAHQDLPHSAADLARLYRSKDVVEKDFQTIKSLVELRPLWHRTEVKVRAHVTLCMLALLLERTLSAVLKGRCSARKALEELEPCRLNRLAAAPGTIYALTELKPDQAELLRALGMLRLSDDDEVADRITAR